MDTMKGFFDFIFGLIKKIVAFFHDIDMYTKNNPDEKYADDAGSQWIASLTQEEEEEE